MSAKKHWIHQRLSAIVLFFLSAWFVSILMYSKHHPYDDIRHFLAHPFPLCLLGILNITLFYHGYLGLQGIIKDYIPGKKQQHFLVGFLIFVSSLLMLLGVLCVLKIAFLF